MAYVNALIYCPVVKREASAKGSKFIEYIVLTLILVQRNLDREEIGSEVMVWCRHRI